MFTTIACHTNITNLRLPIIIFRNDKDSSTSKELKTYNMEHILTSDNTATALDQ